VISEPWVGTWDLERYRSEKDSTWKQFPDSIFFQKHLTSTHYTWVNYDPQLDEMIRMSGGTYQYDGTDYIEKVAFYVPEGSDRYGQEITYQVDVEENEMFQRGYFRIREYDPVTKEFREVDSTKFEAVWKRVKSDNPYNLRLSGTWNLNNYREDDDSVWIEYPEFVRYIKLITPTNFIWIKYNGEEDEVMAAGGGTHDYDGENLYTEEIQVFYPTNSKQVGTQLRFHCEIKDSTHWHHQGYFKRIEFDGDEKIVLDSSYVDEIWELFKTQSPV